MIVQECILNLKRSGFEIFLTADLSIEGIFRKNGNIRRLKEQCGLIDSDPGHVDLQSDNAIQIAALLKKFLRDLPEPLLTNNLYDLFMCVPSTHFLTDFVEMDKKEDKNVVMQLILCLLPKPNVDLLSVLVRFFVEVATFSGNKMNIDNLATVIAPNILYTKAVVPESSSDVVDIVKILLQSHTTIFRVNFCDLRQIPAVVLEGLSSDEFATSSNVDFVQKFESNNFVQKSAGRMSFQEGMNAERSIIKDL